MIETIDVKINGKTYKYSKGISVAEVLTEHTQNFKYPIILAKINNRLRELSASIEEDSEVEFLDLTSPEGNRVHVNGLIMVLFYAINTLYGKKSKVTVENSIDKGIYIKTDFKLSEVKVQNIKVMMKEIIKKDLPISRLNIDRIEAIDYFKETGHETKAGVLKYITDNYINLYRLGNVYDYFYSLMPTSTSQVKDFDLTYVDEHGLVLRFPTIYISDKIKKYQHHPHMFEMFEQYKKWANIIGVETAVDLNKLVSTGKVSDLIKMDETVQTHRLLTIAKEIYDKQKKIKIVLLAGPSSAGKTTTSKKLCIYFNILGLHPVAISMDNYFVDKKDNPKDENGEYDFECLEAVDLKLFSKTMKSLLSGKETPMPTFDFYSGEKEFKSKMKMASKDILLIEGIHALNPKVLGDIDPKNKFKIYLSPLTAINVDRDNRVLSTDNRLLRRIVRDNRTRGYSVSDTLSLWDDVRAGEEKNIFPFQDEADVVFNTSLIYEYCVLKTYVLPLLFAVKHDDPNYDEAVRLMKVLDIFLPIPSESIPADSLLREFIGNSSFE